jgi:hypothetical protein
VESGCRCQGPASGSGHRRRGWGAAFERQSHQGWGTGVATPPSGSGVVGTADGVRWSGRAGPQARGISLTKAEEDRRHQASA